MIKDLVAHLLEAPDGMLDETMKVLIRKWADPPKALEILEVLDQCIHGALASGFAVQSLQFIYKEACQAEDTTHAEVVKLARWRDKH